ncbi:MAG: hypothetical protein JNM30_08630 [Rhodospirillales bacterium]|nr:hypothetical protein [Rhodospirillales bacterium]
MESATKRNPLLPWWIGLGIVAVADLWVAYKMLGADCQATGIAELIVVIVIPAVYLALMFLTFKSQP